jgi:hypothetical protein
VPSKSQLVYVQHHHHHPCTATKASAWQGKLTDDGKRQGFGVYKFGNGFFEYEGEYVNGEKHGKWTVQAYPVARCT